MIYITTSWVIETCTKYLLKVDDTILCKVRGHSLLISSMWVFKDKEWE